MSQPVFRFAPSPNGQLHLGHAYSALLNEKLASEAGGRLLLRIEDTDNSRCRPEFTRAILQDLQWLGLSWQDPVRIQSQHFPVYEKALQTLWDTGHVYPCFCSRKESSRDALETSDPDGQPHYGGACRNLPKHEAEFRIQGGKQHGWRLKTDGSPAHPWGDVIIAKPKVGSWYHISVTVDDALQEITHVVRGQDLEAATCIHQLLQAHLKLPTPHYHHHKLIADDAGQKLSKSLKSKSLAALRDEGVTPQSIRETLGFG